MNFHSVWADLLLSMEDATDFSPPADDSEFPFLATQKCGLLQRHVLKVSQKSAAGSSGGEEASAF